MKALICPNEPVDTGFRVAEISEEAFEVAQPWFWVDCDDAIVAGVHFYEDGVFKEAPPPPAPEVSFPTRPQPVSTGTQEL